MTATICTARHVMEMGEYHRERLQASEEAQDEYECRQHDRAAELVGINEIAEEFVSLHEPDVMRAIHNRDGFAASELLFSAYDLAVAKALAEIRTKRDPK